MVKKSDQKQENILGQEVFEKYYKNKGFKLIDPVDYSLREKIAFMKGADEVATVSATNHLYTIFCKPSAKITILTRTYVSSYNTSTLRMFSEMMDIKDVYVVDVSKDVFDKEYTWSLHLLQMTKQFKRYAKAYFNDDINLDDYAESNKSTIMEYFQLLPKYYAKDERYFKLIKNLKMSTVLQNLSWLFYDEDFNTEAVDLVTNEDKLKNQVKQLTEELNKSKKRVAELESQIKNSASNCKILSGSLSITPDEANVPKKKHVDFPEGLFAKAPSVFANPKTSVPGTKFLGISVTNITTSGCDIYITRTDNVRTGICWTAIQS